MTKHTTIQCDTCKQKLNYTDTDGNKQIAGFTFEKDTEGLGIAVHSHVPKSHGSSHVLVPSLYIPENICSTLCMKAWIDSWTKSLPIISGIDIAKGMSHYE